MTLKSSKQRIETATSESLQIPIPFEPIPDNGVQIILRKLFDLAKDGNTSAAKLFIDILKDKSEDPAALTAEEALKMLQEHYNKAA